MAVSIGTDTVEGVEGTGIGIVFGVLFSSSGIGIIFDGVVYGMLLLDCVLCSCLGCCGLLRSSNMELASDDAVEDIGEKGFRIMAESNSRGLKDCFLMGSPAMSNPLVPAKKQEKWYEF